MYKYGAEIEQRIRADREELRRCRRGGRSNHRGRREKKPGEVSGKILNYIGGLSEPERGIFQKHFLQGVTLEIIGGELGRSASWCSDRIRRQLAALPLNGGEGVSVRRYRRRLPPAEQQRPTKYRY